MSVKKDELIFCDYCSEWLRKQKETVRLSSYAKYRDLVERHIMPVLGKYRLSELSSELIAQFAQKKVRRKNCLPKWFI